MSWSAALDFQVHGRSACRKSDDSRPLPNSLALFPCSWSSGPTICLYMALLSICLTSDYPDIAACLFISYSKCSPSCRIDSPSPCDQQCRLHAHGVYTRRLHSTTRVLLSFARRCFGIGPLVALPLHLFGAPPCVGIPVVVSALAPYKTASTSLPHVGWRLNAGYIFERYVADTHEYDDAANDVFGPVAREAESSDKDVDCPIFVSLCHC
jgi:hypothetical protein